jgi:hypothetical protein
MVRVAITMCSRGTLTRVPVTLVPNVVASSFLLFFFLASSSFAPRTLACGSVDFLGSKSDHADLDTVPSVSTDGSRRKSEDAAPPKRAAVAVEQAADAPPTGAQGLSGAAIMVGGRRGAG